MECSICNQQKHVYKCSQCTFECCLTCFIRIRDDAQSCPQCRRKLEMVDGTDLVGHKELELGDPLLGIHLPITSALQPQYQAKGKSPRERILELCPRLSPYFIRDNAMEYAVSLETTPTGVDYRVDICSEKVADVANSSLKPWITITLVRSYTITISCDYNINTQEFSVQTGDDGITIGDDTTLAVYSCTACSFKSERMRPMIDHCTSEHNVTYNLQDHFGEWRHDDTECWCSTTEELDGTLCEHNDEVIPQAHWSCCGATEREGLCRGRRSAFPLTPVT